LGQYYPLPRNYPIIGHSKMQVYIGMVKHSSLRLKAIVPVEEVEE
jgi:hypothetical protein